MSTQVDYAKYITDQLSHIDGITIKKMFGEYGIFLELKMVGLICDNNLFIKPTEIGKNIIKEVVYEPPYQGAKPYFLIEDTENRVLLKELILATEKALPIPIKKVKNKKELK